MASILDIAREAGVSHSVVSAVVNRRENSRIFVSEKTKERILKLVEEHGYVPRKAALNFASGKTNTVGIIVHQLTPYFSALLEALSKHAVKVGQEIMPYIVGDSDEKEEACLNMIRDGRVDGIIAAAFAPHSESRFKKFSSQPYNLKIVSISPPVEEVPSVSFDEASAGAMAAAHLLETGCKRLCFFGGIEEAARARGFVKHIRNQGLPEPLMYVEPGCIGFDQGEKLAAKLLDERALPDGVFAYNDLLGLALLKEALKRGIRIPEDLSIIGCDNTDVCRYSYPQLSSIDNNVQLIAESALGKLLDLIEGKPISPLHTEIPVSLVLRGSTRGKLPFSKAVPKLRK